MYDTMKDRRIGPAEVVEKFGVPPDKVIEVQALIGDSTDNVPGVPGIGVKTAAQLIGEYGDLETLLARASEIKQQKRRESLIENADKARLSKRLVTLDRHVPLDVPLADIAVHDPDARRLIAFLKAMEFASLTRRVAEFSGADPAEIEPDEKLRAGGVVASVPATGTDLAADQARLPLAAAPAGPASSPAPAAAAARNGPNGAAPFTPQSLAAARLAAAKSTKVDRSRYETVRTVDELEAWVARARDVGVLALDTETTSLDPDAGRPVRPVACGGGERGRLCAADPSPGRRRHRPVRRRGRSRPAHGRGRARACSSRCWRIAASSRSGRT